ATWLSHVRYKFAKDRWGPSRERSHAPESLPNYRLQPCWLPSCILCPAKLNSRQDGLFRPGMTLGRSAHSGTQRNCSEYTQCGDEAKQLQCRANARCARSKGLASRQAMEHMEQKDVFEGVEACGGDGQRPHDAGGRVCRRGQVAEQEQKGAVHCGEEHVGYQHVPEPADAVAAVEFEQAVQSLGAIAKTTVHL